MRLVFLALLGMLHILGMSQQISGEWYGYFSSDGHIKMLLEEEDGSITGHYDLHTKVNQVKNGPISHVRKSEDSLHISFNLNQWVFDLHLEQTSAEELYKGNLFRNGAKRQAVTLTRLKKAETTAAQHRERRSFSHQDSLRGSITKEREWWDLKYYHLDLQVNIAEQTIEGSNVIMYKVVKPEQILQIDLQPPLEIRKIVADNKSLTYRKDGYSYFVELNKPQKVDDVNQLTVYYGGTPREAKRAPWDGGFSWSTDSNGSPFVATSCQGIGASIWWPNKDHMYDEVDSMRISVTIPDSLFAVANGRLVETKHLDGNNTYFEYYVSNPINNYGVNVNIGDYAHFSEVYQGESGPLTCDYYVLHENLEKAKIQFKQVPMMLAAFEHWFGPYPFYEDGFKLVEVPYLGMEHQSSVTYGNKYQNGYLGRDLSQSGWGLKFDFLIIHEAGHEWFANSITHRDIADMWLHEGFTAYSEGLYVDYHYGQEAGNSYQIGKRLAIDNDKPLIGEYHVNDESYSGDVYDKGATILHTLRYIINDDNRWREILRGLNQHFYHQTVSTEQVEEYIADKAGIDLKPFFDQYLRTTMLPTLEYHVKGKQLSYRFTNVIPSFTMPVRIFVNGNETWLQPNEKWTVEYLDIADPTITVDPNFYMSTYNPIGQQ